MAFWFLALLLVLKVPIAFLQRNRMRKALKPPTGTQATLAAAHTPEEQRNLPVPAQKALSRIEKRVKTVISGAYPGRLLATYLAIDALGFWALATAFPSQVATWFSAGILLTALQYWWVTLYGIVFPYVWAVAMPYRDALRQVFRNASVLGRKQLLEVVPAMLRSRDPGLRIAALHELKELPHDEAVKLLLRALADRDDTIRQAAEDLILQGRLLRPADWLALYKTRSYHRGRRLPYKIRDHAKSLASIYELDAGLVSIEQRASSGRTSDTLKALEALKLIGGPEADALLYTLLGHTDAQVQLRTAEILARELSQHRGKLLEMLTLGQQATLRTGAALALQLSGRPAALEVLATYDQDPQEELAEMAKEAAKRLRDETQLNDLTAKLEDGKGRERLVALEQLRKLEDMRSLPALLKLLDKLEDGERDKNKRRRLLGLHALTDQTVRDVLRASEQDELIATYPSCFCTQCHKRPPLQEHTHYRYVGCAHCRSGRHLHPGVQLIYGTIGAPRTEPYMDGSTLHLPLWDQARNLATPAQIDELHIYGPADDTDSEGSLRLSKGPEESSPAINYDWAINAVVTELQNRGWDLGVAVHKHNTPTLSPNAERLLAGLGREVEE